MCCPGLLTDGLRAYATAWTCKQVHFPVDAVGRWPTGLCAPHGDGPGNGRIKHGRGDSSRAEARPRGAGGNSSSAASLTRGGGLVDSACYQQRKIIYNIEYLHRIQYIIEDHGIVHIIY